MYRGILGDCFLVTHVGGGRTRHMLIDCGALQNVQDGGGTLVQEVIDSVGAAKLAEIRNSDDRIRLIAANVRDTVKAEGGRIDRLVVTHEHYDHISGFAVAKDVFEDPALPIGELWMAWTEDPNDPRAQELHDSFDKGKSAMALIGRIAGTDAGDELADAVALTNFMGPLRVEGEQGAAGKMTNRETLRFLKEKAGAGAIRYLSPGMVLAPDAGIGFKTYVLGPPRGDARLKKDAPSAGAKSEVYLTSRDEAATVECAARQRLMALAADGQADLKPDVAAAWAEEQAHAAKPFARPHQRPYDPEKDAGKPLAKASAALEAIRARYEDAGAGYRTIDQDLGAAATSLALKMDSDTNNTSLALAFELEGGDVLLFPGDAQVGNWLSWGDQIYPASGSESGVTIDDILRRVIFYKVGHHASHNATLKERGLGLMTSPRLTAAIPLVEAVAKIQGPGRKTPDKGWKMPWGELYGELEKRTGGRIVRGDGDRTGEQAAFAKLPVSASLRYDSSPDDLWVELVFPLSGTA